MILVTPRRPCIDEQQLPVELMRVSDECLSFVFAGARCVCVVSSCIVCSEQHRNSGPTTTTRTTAFSRPVCKSTLGYEEKDRALRENTGAGNARWNRICLYLIRPRHLFSHPMKREPNKKWSGRIRHERIRFHRKFSTSVFPQVRNNTHTRTRHSACRQCTLQTACAVHRRPRTVSRISM